MALSPYEQKALEQLQKRKAAALRRHPRNLVPAPVRNQVSRAKEAVKDTPVGETVAEAYKSAANGFAKILENTAVSTVSNKSVINKFSEAGHDVSQIEDIRKLDLEIIHSVAKIRRSQIGHAGTAAASGIASGAAITGGGFYFFKDSIQGKGAKQAPTFGVVASAVAADIAATFTLATRVVASTARYYGFDPKQREEQIFMMSVMGLGMTTGTTAKTAAQAELSQLTQLLFRSASWKKLNDKTLTKIAQNFANKFSVKLTQRAFGRAVPIAGVAIGGSLNYALVSKIGDAANDAYLERFLVEKGGVFQTVLPDDSPVGTSSDSDGISLLEILRDEDSLPEAESPLGTEHEES